MMFITNALSFALAVTYFSLPVIYAVLAKNWRHTQTGRALMWLLVAAAMAVIYLAAGVIWGIHPGRAILRLVTYAVLIAAGVRFGVYMFQTQYEAVRKR